uniref:Uncharacterized protein n=1 Tax=Cannabis sativa TaxID=3483 RepID=A0A803PT86_CANSA
MLGDDTEIQNLRTTLGLMQDHNNALHHDREDFGAAINLAFDEQRCKFIEWRDREMETLKAQQAAIDDQTRQATVLILWAFQVANPQPATVSSIPLSGTEEYAARHTAQAHNGQPPIPSHRDFIVLLIKFIAVNLLLSWVDNFGEAFKLLVIGFLENLALIWSLCCMLFKSDFYDASGKMGFQGLEPSGRGPAPWASQLASGCWPGI